MKTPYNQTFYRNMLLPSYRSASIVVPLLTKMFAPKSIIDIGCGQGIWLRAFGENGATKIQGIDGNHVEIEHLTIPAETFRSADLCAPLNEIGKYDLALCLETAEHLPVHCAGGLIGSLCACSDVVIFSAAIPDQGGTHHINCQWQSWWARLFLERGFDCFDIVRPQIWGNGDVDFWYQQNLIVYLKRSSFAAKNFTPTRLEALDIVHPRLYLSAGLDWLRLKLSARKIWQKLLARATL